MTHTNEDMMWQALYEDGEIALGDRVTPRDPSKMLDDCDTFHFGVTHGVVVQVYAEYAASIGVVWAVGDELQTISYTFEPAQLIKV